MHTKHFKSLKSFAKNADVGICHLHVVYGGNTDIQTSNGDYISWKNLQQKWYISEFREKPASSGCIP